MTVSSARRDAGDVVFFTAECRVASSESPQVRPSLQEEAFTFQTVDEKRCFAEFCTLPLSPLSTSENSAQTTENHDQSVEFSGSVLFNTEQLVDHYIKAREAVMHIEISPSTAYDSRFTQTDTQGPTWRTSLHGVIHKHAPATTVQRSA